MPYNLLEENLSFKRIREKQISFYDKIVLIGIYRASEKSARMKSFL